MERRKRRLFQRFRHYLVWIGGRSGPRQFVIDIEPVRGSRHTHWRGACSCGEWEFEGAQPLLRARAAQHAHEAHDRNVRAVVHYPKG